MAKERLIYLDAIKGFSIIWVVFCHFLLLPNETYLGNIGMTIAWSGVPCFMIVSGGLMHAAATFSWKKHMLTILKIYLVMGMWKVLYLFTCLSFTDLNISKVSLIKYIFLFGSIDGVNTGVMWYMVAYLIALFMFPVTYTLFQSENKGRIVLAYIMGLTFVSSIGITTVDFILDFFAKLFQCNKLSISDAVKVLPFTNYAHMLFYFILGAFLFGYRKEIKEQIAMRNRKYISILFVICGTIGLLLVKYSITGSLRWNGIYLESGYTRFSTLILSLGVYLFFTLYDMPISKYLAKYVGRYTMGIYYIHYLLLIVSSRFWFKYLEGYYSFGLNFAKAILVTGICVVVTMVLRKVPYLKYLVE